MGMLWEYALALGQLAFWPMQAFFAFVTFNTWKQGRATGWPRATRGIVAIQVAALAWMQLSKQVQASIRAADCHDRCGVMTEDGCFQEAYDRSCKVDGVRPYPP